MKVCIDAGHTAGENPSPADPRYCEGSRMFVLQRYLRAALSRYGIDVVCTRQSLTDAPSMEQRCAIAAACDLVLSLHTAWAGTGVCSTVDHVRVFHPAGKGQALAQELSEVIAAVMGTEQSPQTMDSASFPILDCAPVGLVVQHSFHTHPQRAAWLCDDENLQTLAVAEAALVAEFYGLEAPEVRYELLKDVKSQLYRPSLERLLAQGLLPNRGGRGEDTVLDLGEDALRLLVLLEQAGVFRKAE